MLSVDVVLTSLEPVNRMVLLFRLLADRQTQLVAVRASPVSERKLALATAEFGKHPTLIR